MNNKEVNQIAERIIEQVAKDIKPLVDDIHSTPPVSSGYYVEYFSRILSKERSHMRIKIVALAMIKAGANMMGAISAAELALESVTEEKSISHDAIIETLSRLN